MPAEMQMPFGQDFIKFFASFGKAGFGFEPFMALQSRNIEALTQANKVAIEGFQTVARRQAEIVRGNIEEASTLVRELSTLKSPEDHVAHHTAIAKKAIEQSLVNARELSEIVSRAGNEAFDVLNHRLGETLDEVRALVTTTAK